ncbi:MAG: thiamine pyrophosphate-dependent enzyme [Gammaproteobacteria bacterium]|jgi:2-oxoglutarate ferredoxin oxidoreductase subunit beta|nr:thiamine pyrophosphate-dependent enzyme [Gammaproteobacteria bacterium]
MFGLKSESILKLDEEYHELGDYAGKESRWCPGCGDNAILAATQKLCRDKQLAPEKTVFVSGIGCAARFPHYMGTYGFHGLHGRALPVAQGVKIRRPDLNVFVNMGDGDCCSIGTAHWIHAIRMNMKMVAMLHDNNIYGLTKNQASPTTPIGRNTATTPHGSLLKAMNPLTVTLGVTNVSFVAQVVEWIPDLLYKVIEQAFNHKGFAFVRILQRCPHFMPTLWDQLLANPDNLAVLDSENGVQLSDATAKVYKTRIAHDNSDLHAARQIASLEDKVPLGILYRDESVPTYDELKRPRRLHAPELAEAVLNKSFDRFGIFPNNAGPIGD